MACKTHVFTTQYTTAVVHMYSPLSTHIHHSVHIFTIQYTTAVVHMYSPFSTHIHHSVHIFTIQYTTAVVHMYSLDSTNTLRLISFTRLFSFGNKNHSNTSQLYGWPESWSNVYII